jgi:hypothetical protein
MYAKQKAAWARHEETFLTLLAQRKTMAADSIGIVELDKAIASAEEAVKAYRQVDALGW